LRRRHIIGPLAAMAAAILSYWAAKTPAIQMPEQMTLDRS
jgi:hypothetical protein